MNKSKSRLDLPSDLERSPTYLLAVVFSARKSGDKPLERLARQRLMSLGIQVMFADELPSTPRRKRR